MLARLLLADTVGATALEYAFIAAGLSIAILAGAYALGDSVNALFDVVTKKLPVPS